MCFFHPHAKAVLPGKRQRPAAYGRMDLNTLMGRVIGHSELQPSFLKHRPHSEPAGRATGVTHRVVKASMIHMRQKIVMQLDLSSRNSSLQNTYCRAIAY